LTPVITNRNARVPMPVRLRQVLLHSDCSFCYYAWKQRMHAIC